MNTIQRYDIIQATVCGIRFRDWFINVKGDETITWTYFAKDVDTGERKMFHGRPWTLYHIADENLEREINTTALLGIITILEHEAREEYKYRGVHIFNPHTRPFSR